MKGINDFVNLVLCKHRRKSISLRLAGWGRDREAVWGTNFPAG
jgi:hypothetical protein